MPWCLLCGFGEECPEEIARGNSLPGSQKPADYKFTEEMLH
ncbi:MAG: hypothetical protein WBJ13_00950 [Sedimentibacter sp.]